MIFFSTHGLFSRFLNFQKKTPLFCLKLLKILVLLLSYLQVFEPSLIQNRYVHIKVIAIRILKILSFTALGFKFRSTSFSSFNSGQNVS